MRPALPLFALLPMMSPVLAQETCPMERAVYIERQNGYEVRFRPGKSWELTGMTVLVFDLVTPRGEVLWGSIGGNMGTSRDEGSLHWNCPAPSAEGPQPTDEELAECTVWNNVVYALMDGGPDFAPFPDAAAAPALLFADLGRKMRYAGPVEGPGDEPWDVFTLKGCAR